MDENINIQDYQDFENITIAEYVAAKANVERLAIEAAKNKDFKKAWHYAKIYFELSKLLDKRISYNNKTR